MEGLNDEVVFTVNGKVCRVSGQSINPSTKLVTYLRDNLKYRGTKAMCYRGSCGACTITLSYTHPSTKKKLIMSANSCLLPVYACHGYAITTIEGLNNGDSSCLSPESCFVGGESVISKTLASYSGTQCGYCSPGFVMSMNSLLHENSGKVTKEQVENAFGGNICRCTGYRPIFDAFKSLATSKSSSCPDIEDSDKCDKICNNCSMSDSCLDYAEIAFASSSLELSSEISPQWFTVSTIKEIFQVFDKICNRSYMLVGGHTSPGIINVKIPEVYIDIGKVGDLRKITVSKSSISLGSTVTIAEAIKIFESNSNNNGYLYLKNLAKHWKKIASPPVRNRATIGGNLSIKVADTSFPSDIFLTLETLNASVTIASKSGEENVIRPSKLLLMNLNKKVIKSITLKPLDKSFNFFSFKTMEVNQNVLAAVGSAILLQISSGKISSQPNIVFSNISSNFIHATLVEQFLKGKSINSNENLKKSLEILAKELSPSELQLKFSSEYRKKLAISQFYRVWLNLNSERIPDQFKSGKKELLRPLSSGKQTFSTNQSDYPLGEPIPKIEANLQTSGEAEYIGDIPLLENESAGCLVLASELGDIVNIDPSEALKIRGVKKFISAKDIPGQNNIITPLWQVGEGIRKEVSLELFCSKRVGYVGQPIGIILADTRDQAMQASNLVTVKYANKRTPLITVKDVLSSGDKSRIIDIDNLQPEKPPGEISTRLSGEINLGAQYAFPIETHVTLSIPVEDGQLKMFSATQWPQMSIVSASLVTGLSMNKIDLEVRRLGGAYGCKTFGQLHAGSASAVAAILTGQPVRVVNSLETDLSAIGKRAAAYVSYQVGVDKNGVIQEMKMDFYENMGFSVIANYSYGVKPAIANFYDVSRWSLNTKTVISDTPASVNLRGPGVYESISTIEIIMDHIAYELGIDATKVRLANSSDKIMSDYIQMWIDKTDYNSRKTKIQEFNEINRWRKKGLSLSATKYTILMMQRRVGAGISILWPDGTVIISTGGIEMGQGLNTKVAVTAAHELGVPLNKVQVKPYSSISFPNCEPTASSIGSDLSAYHILKCCQILNKGLQPIKDKMPGAPWEKIVDEAQKTGVDLSFTLPNGIRDADSELKVYAVYAVGVTETEVDILTGERQVTRVDILEDCGKSLSSLIDVGQIEGAFTFGLSHFMDERIIYDKNSGKLLTTSTNEYKPLTSKDIPIDFRVTFVENATNPNGVFNSKATGEPATPLAISFVNSVREAIHSAKSDSGSAPQWCPLDMPVTIEEVLLKAGTSPSQFSL